MSILRAFNTGVNMNRAEQLAANKLEYEGKVYPTNRCGDVVVVEYINARKVLIRFLNTNNERFVGMSELKKGEVRDNEAFPVYSIGVMDIPNELRRGITHPREYIIWNGIRQRCYNGNTRHLKPTYKDVTMSDNFLIYSYFKEWCNKQIGFGKEGWELDKDILTKGNRLYSEHTCCFVPKEINTMLTNRRKDRGAYLVGVSYKKRISKFVSQISKYGKIIHLGCFRTPEEAFYVYKKEKESYIKELANKWKDKIDHRVYEALMNWTIEITD